MFNNPALNPLMSGNAMSGAVAPVKQLMNAVRFAQNPQAALAQAIQSNPQYAQLQNILQQYGNDPGKAFRELAQQTGYDPDEILRNLI